MVALLTLSLPLLVPLLVLLPQFVECGPWCFKCDDVHHPALCQEVTKCGDHELCYAERHTNNLGATEFTSGCKSTADCMTTVRKRSAVVTCSECCQGTACNENLCQAENYSNGTRRWCAECQRQRDPAYCDKVNLCSPDQMCSVTKSSSFFGTTYTMGCEDKATCQGKTLDVDKEQCCDVHLCNTNLALESPDVYTPPPPTTTTPPPLAASAYINESVIQYVSQHQPMETLEIFCKFQGYPVPNVTWYFSPDVTSGSATAANATVGGSAASGNSTSATTTTTTAASACTCPPATGAGVSGGVGNATTAAPGATTTTAAPGATTAAAAAANTTVAAFTAPPGTAVTTGVTTIGDLSTLVITSPNASHAGQYLCRAENQLGHVDVTANVTFSAKPHIAGAGNETVQSNARDDVLLQCDVSGDPAPSVVWTNPPNAGGVEQLANGSLLIHNAHGDNSGNYSCRANNTVGTAEKAFTVTITDPATPTCPTLAAATVPVTTAAPHTCPPTVACPAVTCTTTPSQTCPPAVTCSTATCPPVVTCPTSPTATCPPAVTCPTVTCPTTLAALLATPPPCPTNVLAPTTTTTPPPTTTTTTPAPTTTTAAVNLTVEGVLFKNAEAGPHLLQCSSSTGSHNPIIWTRLENDFDHTNHVDFHEDAIHGTLRITRTHKTAFQLSGVYQCSMLGTISGQAHYVLYQTIPAPFDCESHFDMGNSPVPGVVFRASCGSSCQPAAVVPTRLTWTDLVCPSAISLNVIPPSGGDVTWLIKANQEVSLLTETHGHVTFTP